MVTMLACKIKMTIFEPKDFMARSPKDCDYCDVIVSELMVQMLAVEGLKFPSTVIKIGTLTTDLLCSLKRTA
jgi:hypothetical protein